ncbi:phage minor capsid protein [Shouchella hunanensis]|uniref:Minor capsid protein n=1 Tax=Shouchella hunanensis TaxID=766894 RepID=A0ABY7W1Y8_9BACI|nr:phage minor capsid protein [Shouchella hunanensis]WDF02948.1 minor capsid protein [Shouchella hunanensis]
MLERSQRISQPITNIYLKIEDEILMNIARKLKRDRSLLTPEGFSSWQLLKLQDLNELNQINIRTIARNSGMALNEVVALLEDEGYRAIRSIDGQLAEAVRGGHAIAPPTGQSQTMRNILQKYADQTRNTFNMVNLSLLQGAEQAYLNIINQSAASVLTGIKTPQEAVREIARQWADKGIPALVKNGRKYSVEGYLNTIVRTTTNSVTNDMQDARMDEHGVDLVEISDHMGARPKCAPYQGRIFSRSGTSTKYPALSSTSIGEPDGLFGFNCRHVKYAFIDGVSIPRPKGINRAENDKSYNESQKQRSIERSIRKAKREERMMREMGDEEGVNQTKQLVRQRQLKMRDFINDTGRTRRRNREQLVT